jgi:hypothetical protein
MIPVDDDREIFRAASNLLSRARQAGRPVRLLGVAGRALSPPVGQLSLWQEKDQADP